MGRIAFLAGAGWPACLHGNEKESRSSVKIILINLARATERLRKMDAQLAALGLPYERLAATDGMDLTASERALVDDTTRKCFTPFPLSDNEIGCWLSHRNTAINMLRSSEAMVAVLEDDAEILPDFEEVLEAVSKSNFHFDFIFLHRKFKKNERFYPVAPLLPGLRLGIIGPAHMGAVGYIVSRAGAQKFLDQSPRIVHALDKEIHRYWANDLSVYGLERPVIGINEEGYSYIEETRRQETNTSSRPRYPDSDGLYWRCIRKITRICESVGKYMTLPFYICAARQENKSRLQ
jgi:glycosyl transferase family 25